LKQFSELVHLNLRDVDDKNAFIRPSELPKLEKLSLLCSETMMSTSLDPLKKLNSGLKSLILSFPKFSSESGNLDAIIAMKNLEVLDLHLPMFDGNVLNLYSLQNIRSLNIKTMSTTSSVEQSVESTQDPPPRENLPILFPVPDQSDSLNPIWLSQEQRSAQEQRSSRETSLDVQNRMRSRARRARERARNR